jgi:hypothetical protein
MAGKEDPEEKNTRTSEAKRSLKDDAAERLALPPRSSPDLNGQTTEDLVHELQVHQIELEMPASASMHSQLFLENLSKYGSSL